MALTLPKFEITKPGQSLGDIAHQAKTSANELSNTAVSVGSSTVSGAVGAGAAKTATPSKQVVAAAKASKEAKKAADKEASNKLFELVKQQLEDSKFANLTASIGRECNASMDAIAIGDHIDLSNINLTTSLSDAGIRRTPTPYPLPENYGLSLTDIVDTTYDLSRLDLPKLRMIKMVLGASSETIRDEARAELARTDLTVLPIPFLDYSNSAFDAHPWEDPSHRQNARLIDIVDLRAVNLNLSIDVDNVPMPTVSDPCSITLCAASDSFLNQGNQGLDQMARNGDLSAMAALHCAYKAASGLPFVGPMIESKLGKTMRNFRSPGGFDRGGYSRSERRSIMNALNAIPNPLNPGGAFSRGGPNFSQRNNVPANSVNVDSLLNMSPALIGVAMSSTPQHGKFNTAFVADGINRVKNRQGRERPLAGSMRGENRMSKVDTRNIQTVVRSVVGP